MRASNGATNVFGSGMITPDIKGGVRLGFRRLLSFRRNLLWRRGPHCREPRALISDLEQAVHRFVRRPYD
jgi:hypothetical protein